MGMHVGVGAKGVLRYNYWNLETRMFCSSVGVMFMTIFCHNSERRELFRFSGV